MKDYFKRIVSTPKKWEIVLWWVFRCVMIFGIIDTIFGITSIGKTADSNQWKQMCANLFGMFAWEICQATSKKNFMRYLPSYIQDFSVFGFFMASFGGAYLNLYYSFRFYDLIFHIFGGAAGALFGYEALVAMQHRDKVKSHVPFVILAAFGFSFICGNAWEIVEFVLDQFFGSDAQHWCREAANAAAAAPGGNEFLANPHIIPHVAPVMGDGWTAETYQIRWAIMDTMEDIICNAIGGIVVYVALLVCPYHHIGKSNVNNLYTDVAVEKKSKKEVAVK